MGRKVSALRQQGKEPTGLLGVQHTLANALVLKKVQERFGGRVRFFISGSAALNRDVAEWFDAVVACLVFEHIRDVDDAIAEVARVLIPGGRFCFFLNHPLLQTPDSGWIDDHMVEPPEQYWRIGPYLVETATIEEVELGVHIRFVHRPLSRYINALAANGLFVERMVEPSPPPGFLALAPEYTDAATVPSYLPTAATTGTFDSR